MKIFTKCHTSLNRGNNKPRRHLQAGSIILIYLRLFLYHNHNYALLLSGNDLHLKIAGILCSLTQ